MLESTRCMGMRYKYETYLTCPTRHHSDLTYHNPCIQHIKCTSSNVIFHNIYVNVTPHLKGPTSKGKMSPNHKQAYSITKTKYMLHRSNY